jgi:radical SAM protein with 4Fe4S-binding SPASM domain
MPESLEIQQFSLWEKLKDKRVPLSFELEVTARCNNDCRHCYINMPAGDRLTRQSELSLVEISGIADQALKLGTIWCVITGGEPLLRPDFEEIYLTFKSKGFLVSVFTNATLINDRHIALFKHYPPRDIEVTVYGVTRKTYEAVTRKPGSYEKFKTGLNALIDAGIRVRLKAMALQSNLHEQAAIAEFCRERTTDYFRFDPQLHLRFDNNTVRNAEIRMERLTPGQIITLESSDAQHLDVMKKKCDLLVNDEFNNQTGDQLFYCGAGEDDFSVSYDGRFQLCSSLRAPGTTYDLRQGTLAEAWYEFAPRVRGMRSQRKEFLESCRKCAITNLCLWCPANALLETGDMDRKVPYFCEVAHARAAMLKK